MCIPRKLHEVTNKFFSNVKVRSFGSTLARGMEPRASTAKIVSPGMPGALAAVILDDFKRGKIDIRSLPKGIR